MISVLYLDDDPAHCDIVKRFLEKSGKFSVETVVSAREALHGKNLSKYDAVIADYSMPLMDGIEFLKKVRASGNTIPFILFTRKSREEIIIQALNEGADFYLQKGPDIKAQFAELEHKILAAVDRRRSELALYESERNYREIFNSTSEAIMIEDAATGRIIDVNDSTLRMYGYPNQEDILRYDFADLSAGIPPFTHTEAGMWTEKCVRSGPQVFEWHARKKSGELFWVEVSLRKTEIGGKGRILAVIRDITERKKTESALQESEERFRILADNALEGIMIHENGEIRDCNRRFAAMFGYTPEEIIGKNGYEFMLTRDSLDAIASWKKRGFPPSIDITGIKKDGTTFPGQTSSGRIIWKGRPATVVQMHDITGRKTAENALRDSEEKYRTLADAARDIIYIIDRDDRVIYVNRFGLELLHKTSRDVLGKNRSELFPDSENDRQYRNIQSVFSSGQPLRSESSVPLPWGDCWQDTHLVPLKSPDGRVIAVMGVSRDITERKEAEIALKASEEKTRAYIENSPVGIFVVDHEGHYIDVNLAACAMTGYSRGELLSLAVPDIVPPGNRAGLGERLRAIQETGHLSLELPLRKKDGSDIVVMLNAVRLANGSAVAFCEDITARKKAEEDLRESEALFREVFNNANDAVTLVQNMPEGPGKFLLINDKMAQMLGYTREELLQKSPSDIVPAEFMKKIQPDARKTLYTRGEAIFESVYQKKDGGRVPVEVSIHRFCYRGDDVALGIIRDISGRKAAETAIRESEEKYRVLVERVNEGIYIYKGNQFVFVNDKVSAITGYSAAELYSMPLLKIIHPKDRDMIEDIIGRRIRGEPVPERYDCRILRKDGTTRFLDLSVSTIHYQGSLAALGCARDVTQRTAATEELRFKNVLLTTQQEVSPEAILIVDENGKIVSYNRQFVQIWNIPEDLVAGRVDEPVLQHVTPQLVDPPAFLARVRHLYEHRDEKSFEELALNDGRIIERFSSPMLGEGGRYYGRVWYFRDITDRKRAEDALRIANKKLTLLSGITRHDIKNQILSLLAYLDLSRQSLASATEMQDYIAREEQIVKTIERQILFTRQYEKLGVSAPVWQNVRTLVGQVLGELDHTGIEVGIHFLQNEEIYADALLKNVLHNLIDNALRHGGDNLRTIRFFSYVTGSGLVIVCEDDGAGIPVDDKDLIFERGYGKNTGFGLFFIREILDITGITIRETGVHTQGARFEITVPHGVFRFRDE